jgi:hypothetical protein
VIFLRKGESHPGTGVCKPSPATCQCIGGIGYIQYVIEFISFACGDVLTGRVTGGCEACNYCCEKSDFGKFMFHVISLFEDRFITDYSD